MRTGLSQLHSGDHKITQSFALKPHRLDKAPVLRWGTVIINKSTIFSPIKNKEANDIRNQML